MALVALVPPTLLAFNLPPSATFLNQAAALIGWGAFLALLASALAAEPLRQVVRSPGLGALLGAFGLLAAAAAASPFWTGLPWSLAGSSIGMIAAAGLTALVAASLQRQGHGPAAFRAFCIGLVVAGVFSSVIGIVQVLAPGATDGNWIARSVLEGRAVGNLRQPNHLSSLLLWSLIAAVWLGEARVLGRVASAALVLLFLFVTVLSASRTGALGALLLAVWGVADRRLARGTRTLLMLMPIFYIVAWTGTTAWAHYSSHVFGGETRFNGAGDVSSSRFGIWGNTLALIGAHPWLGVGFGEFNLAWTLTPFPGRPVAFFDHTHNLPLQFAVELGLPLAALVLGLLGVALWQSGARARAAGAAALGADPADAATRRLVRAAFVMVLMICLHSLVEYPLWYAYFLLPASFAFGLTLADAPVAAGVAAAAAAAGPAPAGLGSNAGFAAARTAGSGMAAETAPAGAALAAPRTSRPLLIAALLLLGGGFFSLYDYARVVVIFAPADDAAPLPQRIDAGRRSWFFAHHGDYAAATTVQHPSKVMAAFRRAPHYLLDARLLMAWATALNEAGDSDRARYVAARLKEFRSPQAGAFFEVCELPPPPGEPLPFQCLAPERALTYDDFRGVR